MLNLLRSRHPIAIGGFLLAFTVGFGQGLQTSRSISDYPIHQKPLELPFDERQYTEPAGNLTARFYLRMQEFAAEQGTPYELAKVTPRLRAAMSLQDRQRADVLLKGALPGALASASTGEVRCRVTVRAALDRYDADQQCFPVTPEMDAYSKAEDEGLFRVYLPALTRDNPEVAPYTHFSTAVPSLLVMNGKPALPDRLSLPEGAADWLKYRTPGGFDEARLHLYLRLVGADTRVVNKKAGPELVPIWEIEHFAFEDIRNGERLAVD
jgi:hypothetical protein